MRVLGQITSRVLLSLREDCVPGRASVLASPNISGVSGNQGSRGRSPSRVWLLPQPLLLAGLLICGLAVAGAATASPPLERLQPRKHLKVLVTDSGLGGLSVCGDLERKALARKVFESVEIVFCNALPEAGLGYNNLDSPQRKARVFSDALGGMVKWYQPDIVLIACNTLSVVYPDTDLSRTLKVPVVGIVDLGVDMIVDQLQKQPGSCAVVFGTETTIAAGTHRTKCLAKGIDSARIVAQPCAELAAEIQTDPRGEAARNLIDLYVEEAVSHLPKGSNHVIAAMCCTHYGYCADMFTQAFATAGRKDVGVVNPNEKMADLLFASGMTNRLQTSSVVVKVVSRALLSPDETRAISALLEKDSPLTAAALRQYERKADLFPFWRE
jgi:glutamate racemase